MNTVGPLIGLLALAGTVVWFCERRANPDQFSSEPRHGIGNGLWWAALTMSTVGYGDKAPRTGLGRVLAVVWMFGAIVLIALLTAQVTSFLTVSSLSGVARGPADLIHVRVGAIEDSPAKALLRDKFGVAAISYPASTLVCARSTGATLTLSSGWSRSFATVTPAGSPDACA
jgi:hypothetical protein